MLPHCNPMSVTQTHECLEYIGLETAIDEIAHSFRFVFFAIPADGNLITAEPLTLLCKYFKGVYQDINIVISAKSMPIILLYLFFKLSTYII
jgi:hypothetical protein